ncbi:16S rRNA (adenine(1518)-N(6)/adenine(1519)-N(6))-dimethyltransferase RsmA [Actinomadura graeca]|uniref:Ribosomal RNA small subunit methyltransferase A n=1 Tax=Actinomadura graeca TaxID=2750812 RepID=A0ABX8QZW4_9ACTN|nr:16S rRNA (adenine(1518)-N(6)/adenine(1519)-N(6))-dimethyltransferase RsmA [Actinomadura graeca]
MGEKQGLLGAADVRALAGRLGIRPTKTLGQNFVIDANTVRRIVRTADLRPDDVVIEVGPGLGSLTLALLPQVGRVVAVEIDPALAAELPATAAAREPDLAGRLEIVHADAMKVTAVPGPEPTALVANLPYNVAVPVVLHLLASLPSLRRALVMVQAEVADRMVAAPGSKIYGVPSVKIAWYGEARRAGAVGRAVFWPAPNVDSGLVAFTRREPPPTTASRERVFAVIDAAFAQRRKTLRAALAGWAGSAAEAERALRAADVDPRARGEALDVAAFARIAEYGPLGGAQNPPAAGPGGTTDPEEAEGDGEGAFADGAGGGARGGADRDGGSGGPGGGGL